MFRPSMFLSIFITIGLSGMSSDAAEQSISDANVQVLAETARDLKFILPENKAYFLVKQETIHAEVAVIFGYTDNQAACQQIARILTKSFNAGTFQCTPIY
ncbi:hypothetical protein [Microbaculum sp. FT89]|uniref:hypothetical protein n=1 Tax=Microbaculum sp. FT89 TaxID=3447298 RepID=UPI003F535F30